MSKNGSSNPLAKAWQIISNVSGIVGLINLTKDIIEWSNLFLEITEIYRIIVYWPFDFFRLDLPSWLKDYLFISLLLFSSFIRSAPKETMKIKKRNDDQISERRKNIILFIDYIKMYSLIVILFSTIIVFWPFIFVVIVLLGLRSSYNDEVAQAKKILQWTGFIISMFLFCLMISATLKP